MDKKYQAPAARKLLDIIELMATQYRAYTVTEISSILDITVNSAFRILKELEEGNYVEKEPDSVSYKLTGKLYYLGSLVGNNLSFKTVASKYLEKIADLTGETTLLAVMDDNFNTVVIDQATSKQMVKFVSTVGGIYPTNTSVLGKAMLSTLSPDQLAQFFSEYHMVKSTENTIIDICKMKMELENIKKIGYAVDDEESCIGIRCVGVPLADSHGKLLGAICISGPAYRLDDEKIKTGSKVLLNYADEILKEMGERI